jgi:hypothetical protein
VIVKIPASLSQSRINENIASLCLVKFERRSGVGIGQKKFPDLLAALLSLVGNSARCSAANPIRIQGMTGCDCRIH